MHYLAFIWYFVYLNKLYQIKRLCASGDSLSSLNIIFHCCQKALAYISTNIKYWLSQFTPCLPKWHGRRQILFKQLKLCVARKITHVFYCFVIWEVLCYHKCRRMSLVDCPQNTSDKIYSSMYSLRVVFGRVLFRKKSKHCTTGRYEMLLRIWSLHSKNITQHVC